MLTSWNCHTSTCRQLRYFGQNERKHLVTRMPRRQSSATRKQQHFTRCRSAFGFERRCDGGCGHGAISTHGCEFRRSAWRSHQGRLRREIDRSRNRSLHVLQYVEISQIRAGSRRIPLPVIAQLLLSFLHCFQRVVRQQHFIGRGLWGWRRQRGEKHGDNANHWTVSNALEGSGRYHESPLWLVTNDYENIPEVFRGWRDDNRVAIALLQSSLRYWLNFLFVFWTPHAPISPSPISFSVRGVEFSRSRMIHTFPSRHINFCLSPIASWQFRWSLILIVCYKRTPSFLFFSCLLCFFCFVFFLFFWSFVVMLVPLSPRFR